MEMKDYGEQWRSWNKGCLSTCNMSVVVNGKPRERFRATQGLRQGDPLSFFLFILVADVLGRMVDRARVFEGLEVGRERVSVTHWQYTDDTILFSAGDERQIVKLFHY